MSQLLHLVAIVAATNRDNIIATNSRIWIGSASILETTERIRVMVEKYRWRTAPKNTLGTRIPVSCKAIDDVAAVIINIPSIHAITQRHHIANGKVKTWTDS